MTDSCAQPQGNRANGQAAPAQAVVEIPKNVTPGQTKLQVQPDENEGSLLLTVPMEARPGDHLILTKGADCEWACYLQKQHKTQLMHGQTGTAKEARLQVPDGAQPGQTNLQIKVGEEIVQVTVPEKAKPGDWLLLNWDDAQMHWTLTVQRDLADGYSADSEQDVDQALSMKVIDIDQAARFEAMKAAACSAGAFVSSKLARGTSPQLGVLGMIVTEPVATGEVLMRIPADLHISEATCASKMSLLFNAIASDSSCISPLRRQEVGLTACVSALMCDAFSRAQQRQERSSITQDIPELWHRYADMLVAENFAGHPYVRCLTNPGMYQRAMAPSGEPAHYELMAGDTLAINSLVKQAVPAWSHLIGKEFRPGIYMGAKLSLLSREFGTKHGSALVPIVDLCNHSAHYGARQSWDKVQDAMVVTAARAHVPGEELFISYGFTSNPLLLRTYGFTLPPELEPNWTIAFPVSELMDICSESCRKALEQAFLEFAEFQLSTADAAEYLLRAASVCARAGEDAPARLRELFSKKSAQYEQDASISTVLASLEKARAKDPQHAAWWQEMPDHGFANDELQRQALAVKMSEHICLLAHLEALNVIDHKRGEEFCLKKASTMRAALIKHLQGISDRKSVV